MPNEIRQNESRLNKLILEQSNILHKAKQLSDRASLGHYYDLTEQEQQLVEKYDCGQLEADLRQLQQRQAPAYRGAGASVDNIVTDMMALAASSAAQPAPRTDTDNLEECERVLQTWSSQDMLHHRPVQRVREVVNLLKEPSDRQNQRDIQKHYNDWEVVQKLQGVKRCFKETRSDLLAKVVEETRRLKRLRTDPSTPFSAIQAALRLGRSAPVEGATYLPPRPVSKTGK